MKLWHESLDSVPQGRQLVIRQALIAAICMGLAGQTAAQQSIGALPNFKDERRLPAVRPDQGSQSVPISENDARTDAEVLHRATTAHAKWQAEADASRAAARRRAEEDARHQAALAEASREAEDEARRAAVEAARTAEEDMRRVTREGDTRRRAEEEAHRFSSEAEATRSAAEQPRRIGATAEAERRGAEASRLADAWASRKEDEARGTPARSLASRRSQEQPRQAAVVAEVKTKQGARAAPPGQPDQARRLVARGQRLLRQGNIVAARTFFQRAAQAGSAQGALELGTTYDPAALRQLGRVAVAPDKAAARLWYMRARELGAPAATELLRALDGR